MQSLYQPLWHSLGRLAHRCLPPHARTQLGLRVIFDQGHLRCWLCVGSLLPRPLRAPPLSDLPPCAASAMKGSSFTLTLYAYLRILFCRLASISTLDQCTIPLELNSLNFTRSIGLWRQRKNFSRLAKDKCLDVFLKLDNHSRKPRSRQTYSMRLAPCDAPIFAGHSGKLCI